MITPVLAIILGIILLLILYTVAAYNRLVRGRNMVDEAWSGVDVQLKRRHDLIPSLVNTVKGYAAHERETLEAVINARAAAMGSSDVEKASQSEGELSHALKRLMAISERYPELKANENFMQLQKQLSTLEDEIQMSRRYYNGQAREQNNRVLMFPGNIIAGMFGFSKVPFFTANEADRAVPEVKF